MIKFLRRADDVFKDLKYEKIEENACMVIYETHRTSVHNNPLSNPGGDYTLNRYITIIHMGNGRCYIDAYMAKDSDNLTIDNRSVISDKEAEAALYKIKEKGWKPGTMGFSSFKRMKGDM